MEYCCDLNKDNYSQRNNEFYKKIGNSEAKGSTMCNVTAMVEGLYLAGYKFPSGKFEQPEDNLMDFIINNEEIDIQYKNTFPAMYRDYKEGKKDCYWPNEIHSLLCKGTNLWMETSCVEFIEGLKIWDYLKKNFVDSAVSLPVVVSGSFPKSNGSRLNHIVLVTGVKYENGKITEIKWDDPYGNTLTDWTGSGNDVWVSREYAELNLKPLGSKDIKWAHVFSRPAAII